MDKQFRKRVPKGQSTGGQFSRERKNEAKVSLMGTAQPDQGEAPEPRDDFSPESFGEEQMRAVMEDPSSDANDRLSAVHSMNLGASDLALTDNDPLIRAQTLGLVDATQEQWDKAMSDPETRRIYNFLTQK